MKAQLGYRGDHMEGLCFHTQPAVIRPPAIPTQHMHMSVVAIWEAVMKHSVPPNQGGTPTLDQ